ncbi:MAG: hypothetical protein IMX05_09105 [Hydrogenibacillus schlegelii]|nr:hypothetical protein [Hydrogenibacillus schlegelii]
MAYIVGNREKVWGVVHGDTYYRRVNRARHFYRRLGGYAIQREAVLRMLANGVKKVRIHELDTGRRYVAPLVAFITYGELINDGHGEQWVLPLNRFREVF